MIRRSISSGSGSHLSRSNQALPDSVPPPSTAAGPGYFVLDLRITRSLQAFHPPWFDRLMRLVSYFGYPPQANVFGALLVLFFYVRGAAWEAATTLFAALGGIGLFYATAFMIRRPRPSPKLIKVSTRIDLPGFPSGHVIIFTSVLGFLIYVTARSSLPAPARNLVIAALSGFLVLLGPARVYSGEHWASDVAAGYALGLVWLTVTQRFYRWGKQRYPLVPLHRKVSWRK